MKFKKIYFTYSNKYIDNNVDVHFELKYELEIYDCIIINMKSFFILSFIKYINIDIKRAHASNYVTLTKYSSFVLIHISLRLKMNKSLLLNLMPVFSKQPLNNC